MPNAFPAYHIGHFLNQASNPTAFKGTHFELMPEPGVEDPHRQLFYGILTLVEKRI